MDLQSPRPATTVRRNPPRRAKQASETLDRSLSSSSKIVAVDGINPFPLHEVLELEPSSLIDPPSTQNPLKSSGNLSNNLKVFLRIRPLECRAVKCSKVAGEETRGSVRGKVAKGVERKSGACLSVNSSSSVTLSAPPSAPDSKRVKSEIYDGFSHVFPPDSLQDDIYEKLMQPLVKNFMEGHSSLLVAMGPTGSGKTYTMFGSPQQLGIVPLALSQIFTQKVENENAPVSRTYYLSMFEIHSERGKGEKILDLSPESTDTACPQTSISSVKEVKITTAIDAENIVSHGIFKRSTAPTNANNQSSRSQCIVNVRCVWKNGTDDCSISSAVLTIADLAGAERERKTGNQGARLLESNFINNTSMVFGLCLRSLLEHQKNPRKPIEKHYKNSLLTRYLQDYMEGKKQMTLILTVKAAEEDYMDTSFILRQASPYMKIKFNQLQENKNAPCQKRNAPAIKTERSKRRKVNISEASLTDGSHVMVDAAPTSQISQRVKSDSAEEASIGKHINAEVHIELQKIKRSEEVMSNFASAFWSMLKQYKYKLKIAENEVQYLKDSLREKSAQTTELEKELKELRNLCSCLQKSPPVKESVKDLSFNNVILVPSISSDLDRLHDTDALPDEHTLLSAETSRATEMDRDATTIDKSDMDKLSLPVHQDIFQQLEISGKACSSLSLEENVKELTYQYEDDNPECQQNIAKSDILVGGMNDVVMDLSTDTSLTVALEGEGCISLLPGNAVVSIMKERKDQLAVKIAVSQKEQQDPRSHTSDALTKIAVSQKEQQDPRSHTSDALTNETDDPALRPLNSKRPKRKLLPASEMLLKDLNWLVMDENAKEIKSKESANAKGRSEGSDSLIRILKSNLPR